MFKAIISAALVFSPLAFAHDEPVPAPAGETAAPAPAADAHGHAKDAHAKHGEGGAHHGHKPKAK